MLSLEWRCGRTTETASQSYQKALKSSRKPQGGTENQEDHFCHIALQTSNTQGLLHGSHALLQTPTLPLRMEKWSLWGLGPFLTSSTLKASGWHIPAEDQRSVQLTPSSPCTHLDAPLAIFTDPFLPTCGLGGDVRRITYPQRYPLTALPRDQPIINWLWLLKTHTG